MNPRMTRREFLLSMVLKNAGPFQPIVWLAVILLFVGLTIALGRACFSVIRLIDSTGNEDLLEESVVTDDLPPILGTFPERVPQGVCHAMRGQVQYWT